MLDIISGLIIRLYYFPCRQLAVQTVFSALDYISKWTQKQRQAESVGKKVRGAFVPSTELKQVILCLKIDLLNKTTLLASTVGFLLFISHSPNGLFCWLCTLCSLAINLKTRSIPGIFTTFHFESSMHVVLFLYTMEQLMQQAFSKLH